MKLLILSCLFSSISIFAAEYRMKGERKIQGSFLKYQPGTILIRQECGGTVQIEEDKFEWETLSNFLPSNNVYSTYLGLSSNLENFKYIMDRKFSVFTNQMAVVKKNYLVLADRYDDVIGVISRYEKAGLLPKDFVSDVSDATTGKKTKKAIQNKTGIPDEVFDSIRLKAKKEWPDDFQMQVFSIETQVKAYKQLNSLK